MNQLNKHKPNIFIFRISVSQLIFFHKKTFYWNFPLQNLKREESDRREMSMLSSMCCTELLTLPSCGTTLCLESVGRKAECTATVLGSSSYTPKQYINRQQVKALQSRTPYFFAPWRTLLALNLKHLLGLFSLEKT